MVTDGSGFNSASATTAIEVGHLSGVTSAIQTQLNAKQADVVTTEGDVVVGNGSNVAARLGIGAANTVLISNATTVAYALLANANIAAAAGIAVNKLAALTASRAVVTDGSGFNSASAVTATELGHVNGVTSAIQTQLNAKQPDLVVLAVSSDITLVDNNVHIVDTSVARSLTLPTPASGIRIVVKDSDGTANTNNITIVRAGSESIDGVAASFTIDINFASFTFVSDGTDWFIT